MPETRLRRLAEALHAGRDHARDGVELGSEPICNCYSLAAKTIPVFFELSAEAWDQGWAASESYTDSGRLDSNPYRLSISSATPEEGR